MPDPIEWLLAGDPAIRWQTLQDVVGAAPRTVRRERDKVARDGWGKRLLAKQDRGGTWAKAHSSDGGLYVPKWTSATYTMLLLRDFGLAPENAQAKTACAVLLDRGLRADDGISYGTWAKWTNRGETCVTGMVLSILSYFRHDDPRVDVVARHLLGQQMPDGGWNCRWPRNATHASVNTTISALEALHHYELHAGRAKPLREAQARGREFLLAHRLFRSHRTGKVMKSEFTRFVFPPRWHYDVLRALDYFRAVDAPRDDRLTEAIEMVRGRRSADGRWPLTHAYRGKVFFAMEKVGQASRWNTLRALRVLKWWEGAPERRRAR